MLIRSGDAELSPARQSEFSLASQNSFLLAATFPPQHRQHPPGPFSHPEETLGVLASAREALHPPWTAVPGPESRQSGRTVENPARYQYLQRSPLLSSVCFWLRLGKLLKGFLNANVRLVLAIARGKLGLQ